MTDTPPRTSRQPKLRSSCDGCGSAKLKCDRGQPECRRCLSLGITCVYGVSRKMGKPPRERLQVGVSRTPGEHTRSTSKEGGSDNTSYSRRTCGSINGTLLSRSGSNSSFNDVHTGWGVVDDYSNNVVTNVNLMDVFNNDRLEPSLADFSPLDAGEWVSTNNIGDDLSPINLETDPFPLLGWPEFESSPTSTTQATVSQTLADDRTYLGSPLLSHDEGKRHDCSREAYDILGSLSFLNFRRAHSASISSLGPPARPTNRVPLDFVLHLNREASERLGRLLSCSCASYPHLAILYASIISRVLLWYYREAGCSQVASQSPATDTAFRPGMSPSGSTFGSWLSAATSTANTCVSGSSTPPGTRTAAPDLAPTQMTMTMGCFNIDDQRVQAALRIQLLLGEMKRTGCLIDAFASRSSSGVDESACGNIDALYKSLGSWLGREHSSIAEMMRSRLREVSI